MRQGATPTKELDLFCSEKGAEPVTHSGAGMEREHGVPAWAPAELDRVLSVTVGVRAGKPPCSGFTCRGSFTLCELLPGFCIFSSYNWCNTWWCVRSEDRRKFRFEDGGIWTSQQVLSKAKEKTSPSCSLMDFSPQLSAKEGCTRVGSAHHSLSAGHWGRKRCCQHEGSPASAGLLAPLEQSAWWMLDRQGRVPW